MFCRAPVQDHEQQSRPPLLKPYSPPCDNTLVSPASSWSKSAQQSLLKTPKSPGTSAGQKGSFIRTVPMQRVQSHYIASEQQLKAGAVDGAQSGSESIALSKQSMQPAGVDNMPLAFKQAAAQSFAALLSLSPESSDDE